VAWEDRTLAEQAQADQDAAAYRDSDDDVIYVVTLPAKPGGYEVRLIAHGINSATVLAGRYGTIERKD